MPTSKPARPKKPQHRDAFVKKLDAAYQKERKDTAKAMKAYVDRIIRNQGKLR